MAVIIILIVILVLLDQVTKTLAVKKLQLEVEIPTRFKSLHFYLTYNSGAALGFLQGQNILFSLVTAVTIIVFGYLLYVDGNLVSNTLYTLTFIFLTAGGMGNLICRIVRKQVVDFIYFQFKKRASPIFNFADLYVAFGLLGLIFTLYVW